MMITITITIIIIIIIIIMKIFNIDILGGGVIKEGAYHTMHHETLTIVFTVASARVPHGSPVSCSHLSPSNLPISSVSLLFPIFLPLLQQVAPNPY